MSQSLDMATALELTMDDEHEAKFVALKNLQTKKLKSLMSSIDAKDKEIAKLKILGKDNRRAQMIQELRKKIRTHETINDILKEELQKRTETTIEDANNLVIRKTLAGPKRFRPLSREELENKIIELEKAVSKKPKDVAGTAAMAQSASANRISSSNDAKSEFSAQPKKSTGAAVSNEMTSGEKVDDVGKFVSLVDEVDDLRRAVRSKDAVIDAQKEEVIRLRSRNAQLVVVEEEAEYQERQHSELKTYNDSLLGSLEDTTRKLAEALEATMKLRAEALLDNEARMAEIEALHAQNEKYMRQHAQLLSTIAELEVDKENHTTHVHQSRQHASSIEQTVQEKDLALRAWEEKYARLEDKLRAAEKKVILLTKENAHIDELKEQLREKNIAYKELKRNLDEKMKLKSMQSMTASGLGLNQSQGAQGAGGAGDAPAEAKAESASPGKADRKGAK
jgi:myosin heavy subunit